MNRGAFFALLGSCLWIASCTDVTPDQGQPSTRTADDFPVVADTSSTPQALRHSSSPVVEAQTASAVLGSDLAVIGALSKEEAHWLERNGFPTAEELDALPSLDEKKLFLAMHQGNGKAAALLGHKRAAHDDLIGASSAFARGAQLGSLYAREQHALVELMRVSEVRDGQIVAFPSEHDVVLAARMEVARMLGDHRAEQYIEKFAANVDRTRYSDDILGLTREFMRQYGATESPRAPDPRPNADLWKELESAPPSSMVSLYQRPSTLP